MYHFDRVKKIIIVSYLISASSFITAVICFLHGGGETLQYGFMNEPVPSIMMFTAIGVCIISFVIGKGLKAVKLDAEEELKLLENRIKRETGRNNV